MDLQTRAAAMDKPFKFTPQPENQAVLMSCANSLVSIGQTNRAIKEKRRSQLE